MERIDEQHFFLSGISHKTAPVDIRERISFDGDSCGTAACRIREQIPGIIECVVLSTCNRTEFYTVTKKDPGSVQKEFEDYILTLMDGDTSILDHFYYRTGQEVIEHLFQVTSGIDSMVVGEPQIFGQVKNAYSIACDYKCTGPAMNRLFHHAFKVGKQIRNSTAIGEGSVSVSHAAVELARKQFGDLKGHSVLLVGAGKAGELCARKLTNYGVEKLLIANRTPGRAETLATSLIGDVIPFDQIAEAALSVDIIITSVTTREPVITRDSLKPARNGNSRPLFLIDLGVPRNIDSDVAQLDNVILYNIDDLSDVALGNLDRRRGEIDAADVIIAREVDDFLDWLSGREVIPVIHDLREKWEKIRLDELEKMKHRLSPDSYEKLDMITRRIVRKILHNPIIAMRTSESGTPREQLIESIRHLFNDSGDE